MDRVGWNGAVFAALETEERKTAVHAIEGSSRVGVLRESREREKSYHARASSSLVPDLRLCAQIRPALCALKPSDVSMISTSSLARARTSYLRTLRTRPRDTFESGRNFIRKLLLPPRVARSFWGALPHLQLARTRKREREREVDASA